MVMTGGWFIIVLATLMFFFVVHILQFLESQYLFKRKVCAESWCPNSRIVFIACNLIILVLIAGIFPAFFPLGFPSDCVGFFFMAPMEMETTLVLHWLLRLA